MRDGKSPPSSPVFSLVFLYFYKPDPPCLKFSLPKKLSSSLYPVPYTKWHDFRTMRASAPFFFNGSYFFRHLHSALYKVLVRDQNGSDMDGYHWYHICFHISLRIRIQIQIMSIMSDKIWLDVDIITIRFKYSNTDMVLDVKHSDSIWTDLNLSKRILRSENICTVSSPVLVKSSYFVWLY